MHFVHILYVVHCSTLHPQLQTQSKQKPQKMYQNYLNNYKAAAARLAQLRKKSSSSFSKYCDQQREMPYFNNLNIESLIILPIQRMPRYKILLEEIIKHTEPNHPDLKQLKSALAKISEVNDSINNRIKEFESRIKVQNIENRFNGKVTNLVTPSRRYIKEGQLCKIKNQDDEDYLFILFSDCILYASQSMIGDKLIFGNLIQFNSKFKVKKTSDSINVHRIAGLFELHSTKESFMLYAATKQQRDDWIDAISKTYSAFMSLTSSVMNEQSVATKNLYSATLMIPNDFADTCMVSGCNTKFSLINRRHHCKYCGFIVCGKHSEKRLLSRPNSIDSVSVMVRVCDPCYKLHSNPGKQNSAKTGVPMLCHKKSGKALELLGYDMVETNKKPKTKAEEIEEELFELYNIREEQMEHEEEDNYSLSHKMRNVPPPPPKQKQRSAAIENFVKLDIEPKLIQFEENTKRLQQEVNSLTEGNESLKQKVSELELKLKEQKYAEEQNVNKLQKQNDELIEDNKRLQQLVESLSSTTSEITKSEKIKDTKIETLQIHNDNLENELKQREEEIKALIQKQTEEQTKHNDEYQNLQKELNAKQQQIEELNGELQVLQSKVQKSTKTNVQTTVVPSSTSSPTLSPKIQIERDVNEEKKDIDSLFNAVSPATHKHETKIASPKRAAPPKPSIIETISTKNHNNEKEATVVTPGTQQFNIAVKALREHAQFNRGNIRNDDDRKDEQERICMTCKMKIIGRALRTKGGLHHRKCHVCSECKVSLAGKKYGILSETNAFGTKKKLCEQCTIKRNEEISKQQSNANKRTNRKNVRGSNLREQMRQFQNGGMKNKQNDILKPSIASKNRKKSNSNLAEAVYGTKTKRAKNARSQTMIPQNKCTKCKCVIFGKNTITDANGLVFHPNCFRCNDCDNELQPKKWRSYAVDNNKKHNINLCTACAQKRDTELFSKHRGNLKINNM